MPSASSELESRTSADAARLFEKQVREKFDMSPDEFIDALHAGKFSSGSRGMVASEVATLLPHWQAVNHTQL